MNKEEALARMVPPGQKRAAAGGAFKGGIVQIHITRACDLDCYGCTQNSQLRGKATFISPENFEKAVVSLKDYFGIVGVFGGNPATAPKFDEYCEILREHIPFDRRGLWCNHPKGHGKVMAQTFNAECSNLNCHNVREAYDEFKRDWPKSRPFGLDSMEIYQGTKQVWQGFVREYEAIKSRFPTSRYEHRFVTGDSRHAPTHGSMIELNVPEEERWSRIANCDINQDWSAMICEFRGELRAFFCEIAGAQAVIFQNNPDYPDTGVRVEAGWWRKPMADFEAQVVQHCHNCLVPMKGFGGMATHHDVPEITTPMYADVFKPKKRAVTVTTDLVQLQIDGVGKNTQYLENAQR